jgi:uncharacterized membrane protein
MAAHQMEQTSTGWTGRTKTGWGLLAAASLLLVVLASKYLTLNSDVYFDRQRALYEAHVVGITSHIAFMMTAALLGPTQFLRPFRDRYPRWHRVAGRLYVIGALGGGLAGLYMSQYSASGAASGWGFALLALGVLVTTATAFSLILRGRVREHREWMTRSYALIFAAVTLRLYLAPLEAAFGEHAGYATTAWVSWIPNLVVAEFIIRRHLRRSPEAPLSARPNVGNAALV